MSILIVSPKVKDYSESQVVLSVEHFRLSATEKSESET